MQGKSKRTKSAEILDLYAQGFSIKEIALRVGCRPEYVRVVARQRRGSGMSDIDRRYVYSDLGQMARRRYVEKRRENARP